MNHDQENERGVPVARPTVGLSAISLPSVGDAAPIPNAEPKKRRSVLGMSTLLTATAMMGGMMGGGFPIIGGPRYRYPEPRNRNNDPNRAKGMKPFDIDGVTIYAGTLKAARKKARLIGTTPN
jgi:hypothetical protein